MPAIAERLGVVSIADLIGQRPPNAAPRVPCVLLCGKKRPKAGAHIRLRRDPRQSLREQRLLHPNGLAVVGQENLSHQMAVTVLAPRIEAKSDCGAVDQSGQRCPCLRRERPSLGPLPIRRRRRCRHPKQPHFPTVFKSQRLPVDDSGDGGRFARRKIARRRSRIERRHAQNKTG